MTDTTDTEIDNPLPEDYEETSPPPAPLAEISEIILSNLPDPWETPIPDNLLTHGRMFPDVTEEANLFEYLEEMEDEYSAMYDDLTVEDSGYYVYVKFVSEGRISLTNFFQEFLTFEPLPEDEDSGEDFSDYSIEAPL